MHLEQLNFDKNVSKFKQLHRLDCPAVLMTKKEKQTNEKVLCGTFVEINMGCSERA